MDAEASKAEIIAALGLRPHPTCGHVAESFRSADTIRGDALPPRFGGPRPMGQGLTFLVAPEARIRLHRIRADQMYHFYCGDPLEVLLLHPDGSGAVATLGGEIGRGGRLQLLIPGNTFHMSRSVGSRGFSLLATTEWPAVEPDDVEAGDPAALAVRYPAMAAAIADFAGETPA